MFEQEWSKNMKSGKFKVNIKKKKKKNVKIKIEKKIINLKY